MSIHALAIHPAAPDWTADSTFEAFLRERAFLGEEFDFYGTRCFRPGGRFFEHIIFHSSHSVIQLTQGVNGMIESEPQDSQNFCQIELNTSESFEFLCGCNVRDPQCPACSLTITDWSDMLCLWLDKNADWSCPACGHTCPAYEVNWQKVAGASRYWIHIRQIHEGEAVPSNDFLRTLAEKSSCLWRYFWYQF